jgi:TP901 family phage tail tape measure protein
MDKYQVALNFLMNIRTDKAKLSQITKEVEQALRNIDPKIKLSPNDVKPFVDALIGGASDATKRFEKLGNLLKEMELDLKTDGAERDFKKIEKMLKNLDDMDIDVLEKMFDKMPTDKLNKLRDQLGDAFEKFDNIKFDKSVKELAGQFDQAAKETTELYETQKKAKQMMESSGKKGTAEYKKLTKEIAQSEANMKKLGIASTAAGKSMTQRLGEFGLAIGGIQQITATFDQFLQPYMEFDKQLKNIGTLGVKNFEEFRNAAIDLAADVPDTVATVTEGIYNAISASAISVKDGVADIAGGIEFVGTASKLAVAGLTDTNSAIKSLAGNVNAYGYSMDQAGRFSDILFNTVKNGVTTIPELNSSLSNVVPTAASFGISFEEVTGAIAMLTRQGVPTSEATTKIRASLVALARPTGNLGKVMREAGVSLQTLKDEGYQVTMEKLGKTMDSMGLKATQVFRRVEAAGAMMALSGSKSQEYASLMETYYTDAVGSADRAYEIAAEGIGVKTQGIMNQIEAAFFKTFGALGDGFTQMLTVSTRVLPLISGFAGLSTIFNTQLVQGVAGFAKSMVVRLVPALFTSTAATGGATTAQWAFNAAMLANPITGVIAGVVALTAGLIALSSWLNVTAEEKMEDIKADQESVEQQKKVVQSQQDRIKYQKQLVQEYQTLGAITEKTEQQEKRLADVTIQLAKAYPEAIDSHKSFAENVAALNEKVVEENKELGELNDKMEFLQQKADELNLAQMRQELEVTKEAMLDTIDDSFSWYEGSDFRSRQAVTAMVNDFQTATTDSEVQKKMIDASVALYKDPKFARLDEPTKAKLVQQLQELADERVAVIEEENKQIAEKAAFGTEEFKLQADEMKGTMIALQDTLGKGFSVNAQIKAVVNTEDLVSSYEEVLGKLGELQGLDAAGDLTEEQSQMYEVLKRRAQEYSETIAKQMPSVVDETKSVVDENGNLVQTYDINIAKLKTLAKSQKEVFGGDFEKVMSEYKKNMVSLGAGYAEQAGMQKEMLNEVNEFEKEKNWEAAEAARAKYDAMNEKIDETETNIVKMYKEGQKAGLKSEELEGDIAKAMGVTVEKLREIVAKQRESVAEGEKQIENAETLAGKWNDMTAQESKALNDNLRAVAKLETEREGATEERQKEIDLLISGYEEEMRTANENIKSNEKLVDEIKKRNGIIDETTTKEKKASKSKEQLVASEISKVKAQLDIEEQLFLLTQKRNIEAEGRTRNTLDDLALAKEKLKLQQTERDQVESIYKYYNFIKENGEVNLNVATNPEAVEKAMIDLDMAVQDQGGNVSAIMLQLQADEKSIKDLEKQVSDEAETLRKEKIKLKIELGWDKESAMQDLLNEYERSIGAVQAKIAETKVKEITLQEEMNAKLMGMLETASDEELKAEELKYRKLIAENKSTQLELVKEERDKNAEIKEAREQLYSYLVERVRTQESSITEQIEGEYDKRAETLQKFNALYMRLAEDRYTGDKNDELSELEAREKAKLEMLEGYHEAGKISEERYESDKQSILRKSEDKKAEIEETYRRRMLIAGQTAKGMEIALEKQKEVETLQEKEKTAKKELDLLYDKYGITEQTYADIQEAQREYTEAQKIAAENDTKANREYAKAMEDRLAAKKEAAKLSEADLLDLDKTNKSLEDVQDILEEKTDKFAFLTEGMADTVQSGLTNLFAGDPEAMAENARAYFAQMAGILKGKLRSAVLSLVLSEGTMSYLQALPFPLNIVSVPVVTALIDAALSAVADPIIQGILSFGTGARFDGTTVAQVGDAGSVRPGTNTEWLVRDTDIQLLVETTLKAYSAPLINKLSNIETLLGQERIVGVINGSDIYLVSKREAHHKKKFTR